MDKITLDLRELLEDSLAAEIARLKAEIEQLKAEVALWQDRCAGETHACEQITEHYEKILNRLDGNWP